MSGGVEKREYYTDRLQRFLAEDAWKAQGPNIGSRGENLTIALLSLERPALTCKLLRSIADNMPKFAGEVLIVDNGSDPETVRQLEALALELPFSCRLVALGHNYGVAGGRNRGMAMIRTEWAMWLDNDIYFVGNPLARIQSDIAALGCHFISLPLLQPDRKRLFAKGGHLYISLDRSEIAIGAGSVENQDLVKDFDGPGYLSNFLFGGACVVRVASFTATGGYDEGSKVGFEDIEFSLRLFRSGMKVGSSGIVALVHDHPVPENDLDRTYETARFSSDAIRASSQHLERKHGLKFWSNSTERWLQQRRGELGLVAGTGDVKPTLGGARKPRIGLVVDINNWAFANIASQLIRVLGSKFDFIVVAMAEIEHNFVKMLLLCEECDLIHIFWRDDLLQIERSRTRRYAAAIGWKLDDLLTTMLKCKPVTTCVYDHLFLDDRDIKRKSSIFTDHSTSYAVCSNRLDAIYSAIPQYPPPSAVLPDGVDLRLFRPLPRERRQPRPDDALVVGWAGNSRWREVDGDPKGLKSVLLPAIAALRDAGYEIRCKLADRAEGHTPFGEMPAYYNSIDVLVCASRIEGTPNPVLEAMACGIPVVSTDVGIVPDVFGQRQKEFMLADRSPQAMANALEKLLRSPSTRQALSDENLASIETWDWPWQAEKYASFFTDALLDFERKRSGGVPIGR